MIRTFVLKPGAVVSVFNCTMGGRFVIEGQAVLIKKLNPDDDQWRVRFYNGDIVDRFIDRTGQADPKAFVDGLNAQAAKAKA